MPDRVHALELLVASLSRRLSTLELRCTTLEERIEKLVTHGEESNRSDTRGADAAGPARPGDDVPPSTAR